MNIERLREMIFNFPDDDLTPEQFATIEAEVEDILAQQRQADEAMLAEIEQQAAKLREKLGVKVAAPPPVRPPPTRVLTGNETDADMGIGSDDEESDRQSFTQELAQLRARGVAKRRSRLEH